MLFLSACSTGSNNQSPKEVGFEGGDYGPIPINLYNPLLAHKPDPYTNNRQLINGAGTATDTAATAAVIASIFPPGAVVFGIISVVSGLIAANQVAAQINQISNELSYQETQIQGIYSILDNTYNQVYNLTMTIEKQKLEAEYNNWFNNIFTPSLFYGYGKSTSNIIGLNNQNVTNPWYQGYMNIVMENNPSINDMTTSSESIVTILQNVSYNNNSMTSLNTYSQNNTSNFLNVINAASLSATTTNPTNTVLIIEPVSLTNNNTGNASVQILLAAESALQVILPKAGTITSNNYMLAVESYNQLINSVYLSNLSVLQSLYTVEATNNYLNYLNFVAANESNIALNQICPLEANGDTTNVFNTINFYAGGASSCNGQSATVFYPNGYNISAINNTYNPLTPQNAESAFVYAQQQLTNLYARRVNILYQQTMKFIYSDHQYPQQGINYPANQQSLSPEISSIIESTPQVKFMSNPIQNYSMLGGNWVNTSNIYQYPITNIDITNSSIESSIKTQLQINPNVYPVIPVINSNNYPTIYQNINTGYYDGESIAVYNNQLSANQTPFYFTQSCTIHNGIYYWSAGNRLICMTWSIASNYSINFNTNNNSYNFQLYNGSIPDLGWLPTKDSGGVYYLLGGYFNVASSDQDYHIYYNSNSIVNSSAFNLINGNGNFFVNDNSLYDGGFYKSGSNYHTAAMQVTLPNNFNFPFYILGKGTNSSASAYASLQLACPAANNNPTTTSGYQNMLIPSIVSCNASGTNGNNGSSIINFTLSDGISYRLELNGGGSYGLHQDAYLELSNN